MPTYDYLCEQGHRFEAFQSMKDDPLETCVECGAAVRRLIGPGAGFLFRGDGFYITDYRSKTYQDKAKAEAGGSAPSDAKAEKQSKAEAGKPSADKAGAAEKSGTEKSSAEKSSTEKPSAEKSSAKSAGEKPAADKSSPRKKTDS